MIRRRGGDAISSTPRASVPEPDPGDRGLDAAARLPRALRARYGKRFTIRFPGAPPFVVLSDPDEIKEVFMAPPDVLHPGEGARVLEPLVGKELRDPARRGPPYGAAKAGPPRLSRREDGAPGRAHGGGRRAGGRRAGRAAEASRCSPGCSASLWKSSCGRSSASTQGLASTRFASALPTCSPSAIARSASRPLPRTARGSNPRALRPVRRVRPAPAGDRRAALRADRRATGRGRASATTCSRCCSRRVTRTARRCPTRSFATS